MTTIILIFELLLQFKSILNVGRTTTKTRPSYTRAALKEYFVQQLRLSALGHLDR